MLAGRIRLSRRSVLRSTLLEVGCALLISCGIPSSPPERARDASSTPSADARFTDKAPSTLDFWYGWPGAWGDACKHLAKRYTELKPEVRINTLEHGWKGEKILPAFAGGNPPDVIELSNPIEYAARGVFLPLDGLLQTSSIVKKSNYYEAMWSANLWKGKLYGIPAIEHFVEQGLAINTRMAEEVGLDPTRPPQTWDDLWTWSEKLVRRDGTGLTQIGFDPLDGVGGWPLNWFNSYGMTAYDPDAQRFVVDDAKHAEILARIRDFVRKWGADNFNAFRKAFGGWIAPTSSFCQERQAMQVNGYWTPGETVISCPGDAAFTYTWTPVSSDRRGRRFQRMAGHVVLISKDSRRIPRTWEFVEFLSTDEAQAICFDTAGGFAGTKSWLAKVKTDKYPGLDWYVKSVTEADELYGREPIPYGDWTNPLWNQARDSVIYGEKSPRQAVDDWNRQVRAGLERVLKSAQGQ